MNSIFEPVHPPPDQVSGQAQKYGARQKWDSGQSGHIAASHDHIVDELDLA